MSNSERTYLQRLFRLQEYVHAESLKANEAIQVMQEHTDHSHPLSEQALYAHLAKKAKIEKEAEAVRRFISGDSGETEAMYTDYLRLFERLATLPFIERLQLLGDFTDATFNLLDTETRQLEDRWYTTKEAARLLRVTPQTLGRWIRENKIESKADDRFCYTGPGRPGRLVPASALEVNG